MFTFVVTMESKDINVFTIIAIKVSSLQVILNHTLITYTVMKKPFKCSVNECNRYFETKLNLNQHINVYIKLFLKVT